MSSNVKSALIVFGIFLVIATVSLTSNRFAGGTEIIPWRDDLKAASDEARSADKPVFAYFTASWCGPCQSLKGTTWADKSVDEAMKAYVPVKIDIDQHRDVAMNYQIRSVPTFVVMSADGELLRATSGALPPAEMVNWLRSPQKVASR